MVNESNSRLALIFIIGFAVFSMFFGSGNLVFPLQIGAETQSMYGPASLGLFLTGILIPVLGLMCVIINGTDGRTTLYRIGKLPGLVLVFMMLALMGPFGVAARCTLVAYGGLELVFPGLNLQIFSAVFIGFATLMIWQKNKVIEIIGKYLSPILITGIVMIIVFGILNDQTPPQSELTSKQAIKTGLFYGYQTMDLLAAFFFSGTVLNYLRVATPAAENGKNLAVNGTLACFVGVMLLGAVYVGFVSLGGLYSEQLVGVAPEKMLIFISGQALNSLSMPIMAIVIMLACLTTIVVLISLFAEFLHEDITVKKVNWPISLITTAGITYMTTQFGFKDLAVFIAEALTIAYPALIVFAVASIYKDLSKTTLPVVRIGFYGTLALSLVNSYLYPFF